MSGDEDAEDDNYGISCLFHLAWGDNSVRLTCLYYPSSSLFTDFGRCIDETANAVDEAGHVRSVNVTMQDTVFNMIETGGEMTEDEDVRDDDGNPFLVLHVNEGLAESTRLYCKRVTDRQNGLTDKVVEYLGREKIEERVDDEIDGVAQRNWKMRL